MHKSLSILSFAAALSMAGAAIGQDSAAESAPTEAEAGTEAEAPAATDSSAAETAGSEDAANDAATGEDGAKAGEDGAQPAEAGETSETDAPASPGAFDTGTEVGAGAEAGEGEAPVYIKEKFGDWSLRCFRNPNGEDPCQLYQLLREASGNPVAEFSVFRIENQGPAVAGATAIVPLVTLLTEELKLSVDGGTAKSYPYRVCTEAGCVAQMGLTAQDIATFKKGKAARIVLVPAQAPDQQVKIDISLSGFTAGYEAVGTFTE